MRIWKKLVTRYVKDGKRVSKSTPGATVRRTHTKRFYGTVRLASGKYKQCPLSEDRDTARMMLRQIQVAEDRKKALGEEDCRYDSPLEVLLGEYRQILVSRGNCDEYIRNQIRMIGEVSKVCKVKHAADFDSTSIEVMLNRWQTEGRKRGKKSLATITVKTANHYRSAVKSFCQWAWDEKRARKNSLSSLKPQKSNGEKSRVRAAMSKDQITCLVKTTRDSGVEVHGVSALDRSMLYLIAAYTGLRASELASLRRSSFDLANCTVTVASAFSKRRKDDTLPLHRSLIPLIADWLRVKPEGGNVWPQRWAKNRRGAEMLREDLDRASIPCIDKQGRVIDFHALRHTFITSLARAGVHPLKAKELARHSTITLTMDVYSHVETEELRDALSQLPGIE